MQIISGTSSPPHLHPTPHFRRRRAPPAHQTSPLRPSIPSHTTPSPRQGSESTQFSLRESRETANYQLSCRRVYSSVGSWLFHLFDQYLFDQNKRFRVRVTASARKWLLHSCMFMFIHELRVFPGFFLIFLLGRSESCLVLRVGERKI